MIYFRDLLRSIKVDPTDDEKRIIKFPTPTFIRKMQVDTNSLIASTTPQQHQQRIPDLST